MIFFSGYINVTSYIRTVSLCLGLLFVTFSCNFVEEELKQDQKLAYYRYQVYVIPDSISNSYGRISAYQTVVEQASVDKQLITPRKKNMLLSEVYDTMSSEYFEGNNIEEAIECSTLAIVLNSNNIRAFYNRACLHQLIGNDSLAIEDYTRVLSVNENYADAYYNRGIIYERQTDFQLAIEDYNHAIELKPSYLVDVYNNRGNTYQEMEFYDKALIDYNKALVIDSSNVITYFNRADTYMRLGEESKAIEDYKKAILVDSTNIVVQNKMKQLKEDVEASKLAENKE